MGHNEDWYSGDTPRNVLLRLRLADGTRIVAITPACLLAASGINSHGVATGANTLFCTDHRVGVPNNFIRRWMLESDSLETARERACLPARARGANHLMADANGRIWDVETSATADVTLESGSCFVHTNHYLHDSMLRHQMALPLEDSRARFARARALLDAGLARGDDAYELAPAVLADHADAEHPICSHEDESLPHGPAHVDDGEHDLGSRGSDRRRVRGSSLREPASTDRPDVRSGAASELSAPREPVATPTRQSPSGPRRTMERTTRRIIVSMNLGARRTRRSRLGLFVLLGLSAALLLAVLAATGGAMLRSHSESARRAEVVQVGVAAAPTAAPQYVTVKTTHGAVKGLKVTADGYPTYQTFFGIRYAQSAAPPNRWLPPKVANWTGVFDATEFGPIAEQSVINGYGDHDPAKMNEDSLRLNIWTPKADNKKRPVLVYIHGGGYTLGRTDQPYYGGKGMVQKNVVYVTLQYRLGPFGLMNISDVPGAPDKYKASGNLATPRPAHGPQVRARQHRQVRRRPESRDRRGRFRRGVEHDHPHGPPGEQQVLPAGDRRVRFAAGRHQGLEHEGLQDDHGRPGHLDVRRAHGSASREAERRGRHHLPAVRPQLVVRSCTGPASTVSSSSRTRRRASARDRARTSPS